MPYPEKYTRKYDFVSFQNANPDRPLPADKVNADLNQAAKSSGEIVEFLKLFTRSDGEIANEKVGPDQLNQAALATLAGLHGDDGDSATIAIGTVTTVAAGEDATVVNSGTASEAILDFEIPQGDTGEDGDDGAEAFVYIAYASADDGTDFTLTFNAALAYIAILTTDTEIVSPEASDFAGLWARYKGLDGEGAGDVTAASNIGDGHLVVGDGGLKGIKAHASGAPGTMAFETATSYVANALFDANTILAATSDNTPAAVTVAEATIVGRAAGGNIDDLSASQVRTIINVEDGADVTDAANVAAAGAVMKVSGDVVLNGAAIVEETTYAGLTPDANTIYFVIEDAA